MPTDRLVSLSRGGAAKVGHRARGKSRGIGLGQFSTSTDRTFSDQRQSSISICNSCICSGALAGTYTIQTDAGLFTECQ